jgi:hypothetical protein
MAKTPPNILYHYCDGDAALAILKEGKIRLSHTSTMNDPAEGRWLLQHLEPKCNAKQLELLKLELERVDHYDSLIACFSEDADSLTQWYMYGMEGAGFCIGIDIQKLCQIPSVVTLGPPIFNFRGEERTRLCSVGYDSSHEEISRLLNFLDRMLGTGITPAQLRDVTRIFELVKSNRDFFAIEQEMFGECLVKKSKKYEQEHEWRLLQCHAIHEEKTHRPKFEWRHGRFGLTPYKTIDVGVGEAGAIRSLSRGPTNNTNNSVLWKFLDQYGYEDVDRRYMGRSAASFRTR